MFIESVFEASANQILHVSRIDRWCIHQRLQELTIPSWCLDDGSLQVNVNTAVTILLVRSVVQQFVASRPELVNWLERCWQAET